MTKEEEEWFEAAKANDVAGLERLLPHVGVNAKNEKDDQDTALHTASYYGKIEAARFLVRQRTTDINAKSKYGRTPLHYATYQGHPDIVQTLVDAGGNVNATNEDGWTLLHHASWQGHPDIVQTLVDASGNVNATNEDGWTPLHYASREGHPDTVQTLVDASGNVNATNKAGKTPLNYAENRGNTACATILRAAMESARAPRAGTTGSSSKNGGDSDLRREMEKMRLEHQRQLEKQQKAIEKEHQRQLEEKERDNKRQLQDHKNEIEREHQRQLQEKEKQIEGLKKAGPSSTVLRNGRALVMVVGEGREGASKDLVLAKGCAQAMGCVVKVCSDLEGDDMTADEMKKFVREKADWLSRGDFIALFVASHGDWSTVNGTDGTKVEVQTIMDFIDIKGDKPKLCFLNKCRGQLHPEYKVDAVDVDAAVPRPKAQNFYTAYSTVEGYYSYRDPVEGSLWLQAMHDVLTTGDGPRGKTIPSLMGCVRGHKKLKTYNLPQDVSTLLHPWIDAVFG